jgi:hypothetical protein
VLTKEELIRGYFSCLPLLNRGGGAFQLRTNDSSGGLCSGVWHVSFPVRFLVGTPFLPVASFFLKFFLHGTVWALHGARWALLACLAKFQRRFFVRFRPGAIFGWRHALHFLPRALAPAIQFHRVYLNGVCFLWSLLMLHLFHFPFFS